MLPSFTRTSSSVVVASGATFDGLAVNVARRLPVLACGSCTWVAHSGRENVATRSRSLPAHGFAIAQSVAQRSEDVLLVEEGSLYPALHRLEKRGWIAARWGVSENNRRAKFYRLTAAGRKQLAAEATRWAQLATAVARVMEPTS